MSCRPRRRLGNRGWHGGRCTAGCSTSWSGSCNSGSQALRGASPCQDRLIAESASYAPRSSDSTWILRARGIHGGTREPRAVGPAPRRSERRHRPGAQAQSPEEAQERIWIFRCAQAVAWSAGREATETHHQPRRTATNARRPVQNAGWRAPINWRDAPGMVASQDLGACSPGFVTWALSFCTAHAATPAALRISPPRRSRTRDRRRTVSNRGAHSRPSASGNLTMNGTLSPGAIPSMGPNLHG